MTLDIDAVIMAHPDRADHARWLAVQLGARIIWDQGHGEWDTGRRAWATIRPSSQWGLVVQDDALPIPHTMAHLHAALPHTPPVPVSLYVGTGRPHAHQVAAAVTQARQHNASWLEARTLFWGVAVAVPTDQIQDMLTTCAQSQLPYDNRIGSHWSKQGKAIRYTWPSLVDHQDGKGLVDHSGKRSCVRKAHEVRTPDGWNGPTIRIAA